MENEKTKNHKWSEYFKHGETWWQTCNHCGVFRIHPMSIAHYSHDGYNNITDKKPECKAKVNQPESAQEIPAGGWRS
ncbi:MAG: hypothetical protein ACHQII_06220 [Bacteroidia bacterium]